MRKWLKRRWRRLGLLRLELLSGVCEKAGGLAAGIGLLMTLVMFGGGSEMLAALSENMLVSMVVVGVLTLIMIGLILAFYYGQDELEPRLMRAIILRYELRRLKRKRALLSRV